MAGTESVGRQPRSGEMFIARMHSQFDLFRNERNAQHFAHFGRAVDQGLFSTINISCLRHFSRPTLRGVSAVLSIFQRQLDAKGRSLSWLTLSVDAATVQVENLTDDRQA